MCGIHGIFNSTSSASALQAMLLTTNHRGGDDAQTHQWQGGGLAINRLSINDIARGRQPFVSNNGRISLVCNGEIYNSPAIRQHLETAAFMTDSDVEAILHLYEGHGADLVHHLDGMFAFILHDQTTGNIMAARDPFGIKPLYFAFRQGSLYLASEMKAIQSVGIALGDIEALPPGHMLFGRPSKDLRPKRWYDLPRKQSTPNPQLLQELLDHSVQKCLLRDPELKVGIFLSGGLDSSILAALAKRHCPDLIAFTIGVPGSPDIAAAEQVARHLDIELVVCALDIATVLEQLPEAVLAVESYNRLLVFEALRTITLAKAARERGIKIVLGGEGADEIFAGYGEFRDLKTSKLVHQAMRTAVSALGDTECRRLDRGTMAASVEARVPFLDTHVVEYAINLPSSVLLKVTPDGLVEKYILRQAASGLLPDDIVWRKKAIFEQASGILAVIDHLNATVSDDDLIQAQSRYPEAKLTSKVSVALYRIFREMFQDEGGHDRHLQFGSYPFLEAYAALGSTSSAVEHVAAGCN